MTADLGDQMSRVESPASALNLARPVYRFWNPIPEPFGDRGQLVSLDDTFHRLRGVREAVPVGLQDDELMLLDAYYILLRTLTAHTAGDRTKTTVYVSPRFSVVLDAAEQAQP